MGSVVAKNGCHAYQVFKPWPMPMLKKKAPPIRRGRRMGTDLNGQAEGSGITGETAN